jgi:hypothetical protein
MFVSLELCTESSNHAVFVAFTVDAIDGTFVDACQFGTVSPEVQPFVRHPPSQSMIFCTLRDH